MRLADLFPVLASRQIIDNFEHAFTTLLVISLVLLIGIMAALVLFVFKYHRSRHPKPARISGNMKLEVAWTVIPTLIAMWMFFIGYNGFEFIRTIPKNAYLVEVHARQWSWTFRHPTEGGVSDHELYVPVDTAIKCELHSGDVVHSFFLPYFHEKEDCVPGQTDHLWFKPDRIGVYNIFCAEFCGNDHAKMITKLHVVSKADFNKYLDGKLEQMNRPITTEDLGDIMDPDSAALKALHAPQLFQTYCSSCHGPHGEGGLVANARSFKNAPASKWKRGVKITDIFRTLELGISGTRMKPFPNLPAWDRFALAHYVASLYKGGPARAKASEADYKKLIKDFKLDEQKKVTRAFPIEEAIHDIAKD